MSTLEEKDKELANWNIKHLSKKRKRIYNNIRYGNYSSSDEEEESKRTQHDGNNRRKKLFVPLSQKEEEEQPKIVNEMEENDELYVPLRKRREEKLKMKAEQAHRDLDGQSHGPQAKTTLIEQHYNSNIGKNKKTEEEIEAEMEKKLLEQVSKKASLKSLAARRDNTIKTKPPQLGWEYHPFILNQTAQEHQNILKKNYIKVEGEEALPPIPFFEWMRLPQAITKQLEKLNINKPTAIQMMSFPTILSCRDFLGVAYTGSGKTLAFGLPMIIHCLFEEERKPIRGREGPYGLILCPSRELARQTYDVLGKFCKVIEEEGGPAIRSMLCMGGTNLRDKEQEYKHSGLHYVVATPGRLIHAIKAKRLSLEQTKYIALDEADRLIDIGFEDDIRIIWDSLTSPQRQTVLFSATMPAKIRLFAQSALNNPIMVSVGRAGAANQNVTQEVEYVREENRVPHLLESLVKTAPPVLIFCHKKQDVDTIHEYLLLKNVKVSSIHGERGQGEREEAIDNFRNGYTDVLVATDIASKGLDFRGVQHVINFDMPKDIEDYVHRIGRTGRGGEQGMATTYINDSCPLSILLDLKGLLIEAKQDIPKVLREIGDDDISTTCTYCGGFGHRIIQCPKLERDRRDIMKVTKENELGNFG